MFLGTVNHWCAWKASFMQDVHLGAVFRRSTDPVALASWYARNLFRLPVPAVTDEGGQTGFTIGGVYFGFEPEADIVIGNNTVLWFEVTEAIAVAERLQKTGAMLIETPQSDASSRETLLLLTDPEGNPIGLIGRDA